MSEFGYPPQFPAEVTDTGIEEEVIDPADPTKRVKKVKSKVAAKGGGATYQWKIMTGLGLKDEEIKKFADPHHWLSYFPPLARSDLQALGCRVSTDNTVYRIAGIFHQEKIFANFATWYHRRKFYLRIFSRVLMITQWMW